MQSGSQLGPRHLDPRVKIVWFAPTALIIALAWFFLTIAIFALPDSTLTLGMPKPVASLALLAGLALAFGAPVFAYNHLEYLSFTYELSIEEVIIREGVLTRNTAVIPYARIQNINTNRTVFERLIGLATLQIETAGTNPGASEGILPGVAKKDELISEILGHVEKAKKEQAGNGGGIGEGAKILKTEAQLLADILKELVQLNKTINAHYGKPSAAEKANFGQERQEKK